MLSKRGANVWYYVQSDGRKAVNGGWMGFYFRDETGFRMYYKCWRVDLQDSSSKGERLHSPHGLIIGYLESDDGIVWHRPSLGLIDFEGSTDNNLVFTGIGEGRKGERANRAREALKERYKDSPWAKKLQQP